MQLHHGAAPRFEGSETSCPLKFDKTLSSEFLPHNNIGCGNSETVIYNRMTSANLVYANASSRCTHFEGSKFFHPSRKESNRGIILRVPTALVAGPQGEDNLQGNCMHSERDVKRRPLRTLVFTKHSTPENNSLN